MKPMLLSLHLGGREIGLHTYGVLIGCGCAIAIVLAFREARRQGLDGSKVLDLSFWMLVTGLLGSRLLYVALNARSFARICTGGGDDLVAARSLWRVFGDCTRVFQVWEGGLVFYGGFIAACLVAFAFARRQGWSFEHGHPQRVPKPSRDGVHRGDPGALRTFWALGDLFAPSLAIGHAFGRLGCFTAGCCFGKACDLAAHWCARFGADSVAFEQLRAVSAIPDGDTVTPLLFPTQLYEAIGELAIFGVLMFVRRRSRDRDGASGRAAGTAPSAGKPGTLILLYALLYGLLRFGVEIYRGDFARLYLVQLATPRLAHWLGLPAGEAVLLSTGQAVSVAVVAAAAAVLVLRRQSPVRSPLPSAGED
jgi:phosphatidylglycerol:prolipoprotein diacylglycerol transferase